MRAEVKSARTDKDIKYNNVPRAKFCLFDQIKCFVIDDKEYNA